MPKSRGRNGCKSWHSFCVSQPAHSPFQGTYPSVNPGQTAGAGLLGEHSTCQVLSLAANRGKFA